MGYLGKKKLRERNKMFLVRFLCLYDVNFKVNGSQGLGSSEQDYVNCCF